MLPTEQAQFFQLVAKTLNAYGKFPDTRELEAWWNECRGLSLEGMDSALKSHREDQDRGERAPRPVDVTRRMKVGNRDAKQCAAVAVSVGQCAYPGVFSDGTQGEGQYYCPLHRSERLGEEAARRISYSQEVPWEEFRAKQIAKRAAECERAPGVTHTREMMGHRLAARGNFSTIVPEHLQAEEA